MNPVTCHRCGHQFYGAGCPACDFPPSPAASVKPRRPWLVGLLAVAAAGYILFIFASEAGPLSQRWPLLVASAVFFVAGLGDLALLKGRAADIVGALIMAGLASLGFFAALSPGEISGGIPFAPEEWNRTFGKIMFASGACLTSVMAIWLLRRSLNFQQRQGGGVDKAVPHRVE